MSYAIIEAGGTQLRVEPGRFYEINRLHAEPGDPYIIDRVLLVNSDDQVTVGQPYVEGATIEGTIISHRRGRKIIVYKMRPKKKTRKKRGHRQELTRLMIDSISINGTAILGSSDEVPATIETAPQAVTAVPEVAASALTDSSDEAVKTEALESEPVETEALESEDQEAESVETETVETEAQEAEAVETEDIAK